MPHRHRLPPTFHFDSLRHLSISGGFRTGLTGEGDAITDLRARLALALGEVDKVAPKRLRDTRKPHSAA